MTTPLLRRGPFNDADLRYLRGALPALRDAHQASEMAAAEAIDPRVRDLARRACARQADDIRAITSMLFGGGGPDGEHDHAGAPPLVSAASTAAGDQLPERLEIDRRFIDLLTAHAEASLASARTELVEGFGGSSRRLAEDTSRANYRELAALGLLAPAAAHDGPLTSPLRIA